MKLVLGLLLALGCLCVRGAPVEPAAMQDGSCEDAFALSAAKEALTKINQDRKEGYVFNLHRLSNVHTEKHIETGFVFYLTLDVVETNCSVHRGRDYKDCVARSFDETPVYGQCKAAIYINKVHRVVRLYKYRCDIRPVPAGKLVQVCPDCPTLINMDHAEVKKTVSLSLEKFNKESGLAHRFDLLKVSRALSGMAMATYYNVEFTIEETNCSSTSEVAAAEKCSVLGCEFAHKGFCKASLFETDGHGSNVYVDCEIYEPEAAEREKKLHLLGGETDHSHKDSHGHGHAHDHAHAAGQTHEHDHVHDHTKTHAAHDKSHVHADGAEHHHTHAHAHSHGHDHGHGHDHEHAHHAQAHDHSGDTPHHHHNYGHSHDGHTHEHDHELALDHDHKHAHLHDHEHHHHHHHHDHDHKTTGHGHVDGEVRMLPDIDQPVILPAFPDVAAAGPEVGVPLPLKEDPQIPGEMEPTIKAFPTTASSQCPAPATAKSLMENIFPEVSKFQTEAAEE